MRKKRFSDEQIVAILKEAEAGAKVGELCRKYGVSEVSFYRWKTKFTGMVVSDVRRLKTLEDENRRLKQIVADQTLDLQSLRDVLSKKW